MPRAYAPELQAQRARLLRNHTDPTWDRFHRLWTAFNALYNVEKGQERQRVRTTVTRFTSAPAAIELLRQLLPPNGNLPDPPPGDTRYDDADPRFRRASQREVAMVLDERKPAPERLGALMVLVYQVRCSLVHGNKNPQRERDNELVRWGTRVLELVVPVLEGAMA